MQKILLLFPFGEYDMWERVEEVFIAKKTNRKDKRFCFVRFVGAEPKGSGKTTRLHMNRKYEDSCYNMCQRFINATRKPLNIRKR